MSVHLYTGLKMKWNDVEKFLFLKKEILKTLEFFIDPCHRTKQLQNDILGIVGLEYLNDFPLDMAELFRLHYIRKISTIVDTFPFVCSRTVSRNGGNSYYRKAIVDLIHQASKAQNLIRDNKSAVPRIARALCNQFLKDHKNCIYNAKSGILCLPLLNECLKKSQISNAYIALLKRTRSNEESSRIEDYIDKADNSELKIWDTLAIVSEIACNPQEKTEIVKLLITTTHLMQVANGLKAHSESALKKMAYSIFGEQYYLSTCLEVRLKKCTDDFYLALKNLVNQAILAQAERVELVEKIFLGHCPPITIQLDSGFLDISPVTDSKNYKGGWSSLRHLAHILHEAKREEINIYRKAIRSAPHTQDEIPPM